MQIPIKNFRQGSIVFKKPGILSENLKIYQLPYTVYIFYWNFAQVSYLSMSTKGEWDFFQFCLDLELFAKTNKDLVSKCSFFTFLLTTQDLNKIKKIPSTLF